MGEENGQGRRWQPRERERREGGGGQIMSDICLRTPEYSTPLIPPL
jgi:hypothetical protein